MAISVVPIYVVPISVVPITVGPISVVAISIGPISAVLEPQNYDENALVIFHESILLPAVAELVRKGGHMTHMACSHWSSYGPYMWQRLAGIPQQSKCLLSGIPASLFGQAAFSPHLKDFEDLQSKYSMKG